MSNFGMHTKRGNAAVLTLCKRCVKNRWTWPEMRDQMRMVQCRVTFDGKQRYKEIFDTDVREAIICYLSVHHPFKEHFQ